MTNKTTKRFYGYDAQDIVIKLVKFLEKEGYYTLYGTALEIWKAHSYCSCSDCQDIEKSNTNDVLAHFANIRRIKISGCIVLGTCNKFDVDDYFLSHDGRVSVEFIL